MLTTIGSQSGPSLSRWMRGQHRSPLREMIAIAAQPGTLSLAAGLPTPEALPAPEYAVALHEVLAADPSALQYRPPYAPLKEQIAALMAERGVRCRSEQIVLTTGAQQAIGIAAKLFLDPGGAVLTEEAIYPGVSQAIAPFAPNVVTVGTDPESGMDVGQLDARLASGTRPAFVYAMADGHNPCGVGLSRTKRWQLVELARRHRVPIVEDDAYGFLGCEADHPPPLRALDDEWVIYVGTFSKTIAPALRLGWMVLPTRLVSSAVTHQGGIGPRKLQPDPARGVPVSRRRSIRAASPRDSSDVSRASRRDAPPTPALLPARGALALSHGRLLRVGRAAGGRLRGAATRRRASRAGRFRARRGVRHAERGRPAPHAVELRDVLCLGHRGGGPPSGRVREQEW